MRRGVEPGPPPPFHLTRPISHIYIGGTFLASFQIWQSNLGGGGIESGRLVDLRDQSCVGGCAPTHFFHHCHCANQCGDNANDRRPLQPIQTKKKIWTQFFSDPNPCSAPSVNARTAPNDARRSAEKFGRGASSPGNVGKTEHHNTVQSVQQQQEVPGGWKYNESPPGASVP